MKERGQIFTLDMFFALALTVLVVSYSGLALEQARRQAEEYSLRYSLERTANDAADVLVKTRGIQENWEKSMLTVEIPGLSLGPINHISFGKLGGLARILDNWDNPAWEDAMQAVKGLFGGSEKFEVAIFNESGDEMWRIWPRDETENSSSENSLEVVVVRRSVIANYGENRYSSGQLWNEEGGRTVFGTENFWIGPGELQAFDWYVILLTIGKAGLPVEIYINIPPFPPPTYKFTPPYLPEGDFWPDEHGGMDEYLVENAYNTITVVSEGKPNTWAIIYLVAVPACSQPENAMLALAPKPAILEVKLWR
ncbi:MAG: hypothetical protein AVW05_02300 [Hadesarchaea archaeon DG-33]|nr:MAG: hypothetical protein AVW05_02300 [Hadesarchaea archaeon DG-33]